MDVSGRDTDRRHHRYQQLERDSAEILQYSVSLTRGMRFVMNTSPKPLNITRDGLYCSQNRREPGFILQKRAHFEVLRSLNFCN